MKQILASIILLFLLQCDTPKKHSQESDRLEKLVSGSTLIFKARVLVLHTTTTEEENVANLGVAEVTDVIEAPESLQNIAGQQVTIHFADINKINVGEERMFFTDPYWLGESIGVLEKGSILKNDKLYDNLKIDTLINQAQNDQDDEQLRKLLNEANLVFSGKVINVIEPPRKIITANEHDPEWKEAEIQIDEMIKGKIESKTIKILFASGKDVMFFQTPKLKPGDEGVFITQKADSVTAQILQNNNMIIEPKSFIEGKENLTHIKSLMK